MPAFTNNPLDPVMRWFNTASDSLRVTRRALDQQVPGVVTERHASLYLIPLDDCIGQLEAAKSELDRLVVLGLTAAFERSLRVHLKQIPRDAWPLGDPLREAVRAEIVNDIESWKFASRLVTVFPMVDGKVRGHVKQIIRYRDWVAHGHTLTKPAPMDLIPTMAYERLTEFLRQARIMDP